MASPPCYRSSGLGRPCIGRLMSRGSLPAYPPRYWRGHGRSPREELVRRTQNAQRLVQAIERSHTFSIIEPVAGAEPGYLRLPVLFRDAMRATAREARLGIMRSYPLALVDLPGFGERCVTVSGGYPGARWLAWGLHTLPTHSLLTERDMAALEKRVTRGPSPRARSGRPRGAWDSQTGR